MDYGKVVGGEICCVAVFEDIGRERDLLGYSD